METNIQEYCRVCLSKHAEMLSIFKDYKFSQCEMQIFEVITKCASVQIQKLDGFSERICTRCMEHLCQAFSFKQLCEESDDKFRHNLIHGLKIDSYCNELGGADEATNEERSCSSSDDESEFSEEDFTLQCGILQEENVKKPITKVSNEKRSCTLTGESKIKSEYSHEDSKVQFGILHEENIKKSTTNFTRLQNLSGLLTNLQKSKPLLFSNSEGSEFNVKLERNTEQSPISCTEVKSEVKEDNGTHNISDDVEIESKSEIYAEEIKIEYGDVDTTQNLNDESSENMQNTEVSNKNLYVDGICGQRFSENIILNEHKEEQKTTFGKLGIVGPIKKLFECGSCDKSFSNYSRLVDHERIHRREKPYKCETCNRCFRHKNTLICHEKIHKGEKPHQCETCNKCFTTLERLKRHKMVHTGGKPYKCDICDKCFAQKKNRNTHMGIHRVCT